VRQRVASLETVGFSDGHCLFVHKFNLRSAAVTEDSLATVFMPTSILAQAHRVHGDG